MPTNTPVSGAHAAAGCRLCRGSHNRNMPLNPTTPLDPLYVEHQAEVPHPTDVPHQDLMLVHSWGTGEGVSGTPEALAINTLKSTHLVAIQQVRQVRRVAHQLCRGKCMSARKPAPSGPIRRPVLNLVWPIRALPYRSTRTRSPKMTLMDTRVA